MHYRELTATAALALALVSACNKPGSAPNETVDRTGATQPVDRTAEQQKARQDEIARLDNRVADVERDYSKASQTVASGRRTATAGLREELKEDVANVKQAVGDLRTTTPENWWDRHEQAMKRTAEDIEADVRRLTGKAETPRTEGTTGTADGVSSAPFESRRDRLVADLRARAEGMERALESVKARGAQETEIDDTRARVKKLREDVDRLASASADDWWDVSKARVTEYVDRVQASVDRLDDNKP
jgi:hypothetical protein